MKVTRIRLCRQSQPLRNGPSTHSGTGARVGIEELA